LCHERPVANEHRMPGVCHDHPRLGSGQ
jgi:hypothetical protein